MNITFKDKLAVVTGATRGIGQAIAQQLKLAGAKVVVTGTTLQDQFSFDYCYYPVNFISREETQKFADYLSEQKPDILINNAGINFIDSFQEINLEDFINIQQVNIVAPFLLCRAVIPAMKAKAWGRIVNISSIFGIISKAGRASYSASKFAIDGLTAALAAEVASCGILANCVAPGFIETDLTKQVLGEEGIAEIAHQIPLGRLGQPEEIAKLVVWLVSLENTYISGQNIIIDGGYTRV